jgi:hypothetical protein
MSRWDTIFRLLKDDTLDSVDALSAPAVERLQSVKSVESVKAFAGEGVDAAGRADGINGQAAALAWLDACDERSAIVEYDGGAPRDWAEAMARLDPARPPADVPANRWLRFIDDCGRFLDGGWAARAAALGWGPIDLFGCNRERPFARVDHMGLLWLANGGIIVELHRNRAVIETERGARQSYRRHPTEVGRVVAAWELASGRSISV